MMLSQLAIFLLIMKICFVVVVYFLNVYSLYGFTLNALDLEQKDEFSTSQI